MKQKQTTLLFITCFIILITYSFSVSAINMKFSHNVKENQSKNIVQSIQNALINAGYDPGLPDGFRGPRTTAALKSFQRDHDLKIDGHSSQSALKAIRNALVSDE